MTFTILAQCERTGAHGVAVASAIPAVGAICPFVSRHGCVSTQSFNNYYFGLDGLRLLQESVAASVIVRVLLASDPSADLRQLLVLDDRGKGAAHTGRSCIETRGHRLGAGFVVGGNMLAGHHIIDRMAEEFASSADLDLPERLVRVLELGQVGGGDVRGQQSAALRIVGVASEIPICDLRVDEHEQPIAELRRILSVASKQLMPFLRAMPTREMPGGSLSAELAAYLSKPVAERRDSSHPISPSPARSPS